MLKLRPLEQGEESLWEQINLASPMGTFLTSIFWMSFSAEYKGIGVDAYFIVDQSNKPVGIIPIEISNRRFSKVGFSNYSPVLLSESMIPEALIAIRAYFASYLKENGLFALRVHPFLKINTEEAVKMETFTKSLAPSQARIMWEIDLAKPEEAIRHAMSSSTRNNINKGERLGLHFEKVVDENGVKEFAALMSETMSRKSFVNYGEEYFLKQFQRLGKKGMTEIYLVRKEGRALAGALVNVYKDTAYYTHGASTSDKELSKLRTPYFLQWNLMTLFKSRGFKKYNMWGVAPQGKKTAISGVSDFKRSFGGYEVELVNPIDFYKGPISKLRQRLYDSFIYRNDRF